MIRRILLSASILSLAALPVIGQETDTDKVKDTAKSTFFGKLQNYVAGFGDSLEGDRLKHLDLSLVEEDWVVGGEATAVIGLGEADGRATFSQLSASRVDGRTTANVGLGMRQLSEDETAIYGGNLFYDREFSAKHARVGVGLEYLTASGSLRANHYIRASGEKTYRGIKEKVMNGTDIKYSYAFDASYRPVVAYRAFQWKGDGGYKVKGGEASVKLSFSDQVSMVLSRRDDDKSKAESKARLTYSIAFARPAEGAEPDASNPKSVRNMLYVPVERENRIRKTKIVLGVVVGTF